MHTRIDAAAFGALLAALWAAHDVADHVLQTDHQATRKADPDLWGWTAMAGHVGSYTALQVAVLASLRPLAGVRPSWRRTLAAVALSAGTHALLDRRWPVRRVLELTGSPKFAQPRIVAYGDVREVTGGAPTVDVVGALPLHGPYLADQALHHGVLAVCAAILAGGAQ